MASQSASVTGLRRCTATKSSNSISPYHDMTNELSLSHSQNSYQRQRAGRKYTMIMNPCESNKVGEHKQQVHQQNYNRFHFMRFLIQSPAYLFRKMKDFYNFGFHGQCTKDSATIVVVDKQCSMNTINKMKKNNRTMVRKMRDEVMAVEPYFSVPVVPAVASI